MNKIILSLLIFTFLVGCSIRNQNEFHSMLTGDVESVQDNIITVDCSDEEVNHTSDTWGYSCPVQITEETVLEDAEGNILKIEEIKRGIEVEVILKATTNLMKERDQIFAENVKLLY